MTGCGGCGTNPEIQEVVKPAVDPNAPIVSITESAAKKVKEFMQADKKEGHGLRVLVSPGGCAGYQ